MNEDKVIELLLKNDKDIEDIKWELQEKVAKKTDLERIYNGLDDILLLVKKMIKKLFSRIRELPGLKPTFSPTNIIP